MPVIWGPWQPGGSSEVCRASAEKCAPTHTTVQSILMIFGVHRPPRAHGTVLSGFVPLIVKQKRWRR